MLLYSIIFAFCFSRHTKHPIVNGIVSVTLASLYKVYFTFRCLSQRDQAVNLWYSLLVVSLFCVNFANNVTLKEEEAS